VIPTGKALYLSLGQVARPEGEGKDHYGLIIVAELMK